MNKDPDPAVRVSDDIEKTQQSILEAIESLETIPWRVYLQEEGGSSWFFARIAAHNLEKALEALAEEEKRRVAAFDDGLGKEGKS